jgi:hypothetical protein
VQKTREWTSHRRYPDWRRVGAWTWSWTRSGCPGMSLNGVACRSRNRSLEASDAVLVVVWRRLADFVVECPRSLKGVFGTEGFPWTVRILPGVLFFTGSNAHRDQKRHEVDNTFCCPPLTRGVLSQGGPPRNRRLSLRESSEHGYPPPPFPIVAFRSAKVANTII